jgi:hypothetical protein
MLYRFPFDDRCGIFKKEADNMVSETEFEKALAAARAERSLEIAKCAVTKSPDWGIDVGFISEITGIERDIVWQFADEWYTKQLLASAREEGREAARETAREEGILQTARNALAEGASLEFIRKITGLDTDTLKQLSAG